MSTKLNERDLEMDQGDTKVFKFQIIDKGLDPESPVDLTGASIWFTGKSDIDDIDGSAVFQYTVGSGIVIDDAEDGKCTVTVAASDTASITGFLHQELKLAYDLQVKNTSGQIFTALTGTLKVHQQVTQATS